MARSNISDQSSLSSVIVEKWTSELLQIGGAFGHMNSAYALKCFLKSLMLLDLEEWSHWEHAFAPMLGPILTGWTNKGRIMIRLSCVKGVCV